MGLPAESGARTGEVLKGKYRLEALIGSGGMGDVYRARNTMIERTVAIKLLHAVHAANEDIVGRFLREAKAANLVRHRNVVEVLDIDQDDQGVPFIVQEYLEGEDLGTTLDKIDGGLSLRVALGLLVPVVEAVGAAHAKGLVHRDLKPDNVFLTLGQDAGTIVPKVLDFGISKMPTNADDVRVTSADMIMGTPAYMSPEQIQSPWLVDARSDIWALGIIVHESLTGQLPFRGESPGALFQEICTTDPIPLTEVLPDVPAEVVAIVSRCMKRDPAERYASALDLARDLESVRRKVVAATMLEKGAHPQPAVRAGKKRSVSAAEAVADTMSTARVQTNPVTAAPRRQDKADPRQNWGSFQSLSPLPPSGPPPARKAPGPVPSAGPKLLLADRPDSRGDLPPRSSSAGAPGVPDFGGLRDLGGGLHRGDDSRRLDLAAGPIATPRRAASVGGTSHPRERIPKVRQSLGFGEIFSVIQSVALAGGAVVLRPLLQSSNHASVEATLGALAPAVFLGIGGVMLIAGLLALMGALRLSSVGVGVAALGLFGVAFTAGIAAAPYGNPPMDVSAFTPFAESWGPRFAALVIGGFSFEGVSRAREVLRGTSPLPKGYAIALLVLSLAGVAVAYRVVTSPVATTGAGKLDATSVGFDEEH